MNSQELPDSWNLCNTYMPISSNHQSKVIWVWIHTLPRISDAIWGTPNPVESSKLWNLWRILFICPSVDHRGECHRCFALSADLCCLAGFYCFLYVSFMFLCPSTCWYQWLLRGWRVCRARTPRIARPLVFSLHGRHSRVEPWQSFFLHQTSPFNVFPEN